MPTIVVLLCLTLLPTVVLAHKKAKYNIVIDTDCGIDDFRTLTCFAASRDFNINSITTVDGILNPKIGANYIAQMLQTFHHEGIPIGMGDKKENSQKPCRRAYEMWKNIFPNCSDTTFDNAIDVLYNAIMGEQKRTIVVACGPLTNIAKLISMHHETINKIEMILWYSNFDTRPTGYNFWQDTNAYNTLIINDIPFKIISGDDSHLSESFLTDCRQINSVYSLAMARCVEQKNVDLPLCDDLLPLFLLYPTFFDEQPYNTFVHTLQPKSEFYPDILITSVLNSENPDEGVIFSELPVKGYMLRSDVSAMLPTIVPKFGYTEYKIAALTSEIHSHLGIYSILGAKAGLRIMEYLHAGLDEIDLTSYAGTQPPLSCFNDGLQVGTGATIGYGCIRVDTTKPLQPAVVVRYNNRKILFTVKQDIVDEVTNDIQRLVKKYGLDSDMYWKLVREISLTKYWSGIDRYDMLDIKELRYDSEDN